MKRAFTLVELLVVVSIIVVLLALLTPALGKAQYQADLVVCASRQRLVAGTLQLYAFDSKKFYPERGLRKIAHRGHNSELGPMQVTNGSNYDIRPPLKGYIASFNKQMQCNLVEPAQMESTTPEVFIESTYMYFWGWLFKPTANRVEVGMFKLGDRFETPAEPGRPPRAYSVLISDMDLSYNNSLAQSGHPDRDPMKLVILWQWENHPEFAKIWNLTRRSTSGSSVRGMLDTNYTYDDGSTQRFINVIGMDREDEQMDSVPLQFDLITSIDRMNLPTP